MGKRKFTDEQEQEICRRYVAGEDTVQLGSAYGVAYSTIGVILKRNGIGCRSSIEARGGLSPEAEAEMRRRYEAGENTVQLAAAYGVASKTIGNIVKRHGLELRGNIEAQGGLSLEAAAEACRRYLGGESTVQLGAAFGVAARTINSILKRNGIERRSVKDAKGGLSAEAEAEACRRYVAGESTTQLGSALGVTHRTILNILERNDIERRDPGGFRDSVQDILDCTGRHEDSRECEFYLFELARYSDTHCKPGIAFDADVRARVGGGEYGEEVLRLVFSTRAKAYFLEQAVLDATCGSADCPEDLAGWAGASEVRAMPAKDMVPVVLRLAEELEDLGVWEFAVRFVSMTAAQRSACQQRAMERTS